MTEQHGRESIAACMTCPKKGEEGQEGGHIEDKEREVETGRKGGTEDKGEDGCQSSVIW